MKAISKKESGIYTTALLKDRFENVDRSGAKEISSNAKNGYHAVYQDWTEF